jgi:hypothetical protein
MSVKRRASARRFFPADDEAYDSFEIKRVQAKGGND